MVDAKIKTACPQLIRIQPSRISANGRMSPEKKNRTEFQVQDSDEQDGSRNKPIHTLLQLDKQNLHIAKFIYKLSNDLFYCAGMVIQKEKLSYRS